jgi:hypothetical protein
MTGQEIVQFTEAIGTTIMVVGFMYFLYKLLTED